MRRWPEEGEVWWLQVAWRESSAPKDMDRRRKLEEMKEDWGGMWRRQGRETINTAHQDAAGSDSGQPSQNNNIKPKYDNKQRQKIGFYAFETAF